MTRLLIIFIFFFFNDTATTEIYTLSLHDALPIYHRQCHRSRHCADADDGGHQRGNAGRVRETDSQDRKSTRLNSSHLVISYAVFCLKKKKKSTPHTLLRYY